MENSLNPAFVNVGFTFVGWNTATDGTGTTFADGASYSFANDLALYAQWALVPVVHTVTFYQNINSLDPVVAYDNGTILASLTQFGSLNPSFAKANSSFVDWNTAADGTGMTYANGASFSFSSDLAIYAQWQVIPSAVTSFSLNGGTGTVAPLSSQVGSSVSLPSGTGMSQSGYTFSGWNTNANGSGVAYLAGATYILSNSATLYAQWTPDVYVVSYSANGGTIAQSTIDFTYGSTPMILATPTLAGNQFDGWFTAATGGSLVGTSTAAFAPSASTVLYARWTPDVYVVSYSANGGTIAQSTIDFTYGSTPLILPTPTLAGNQFDGWFTAATGGSLVGTSTAAFVPSASTVLYARWTQTPTYTLSFSANGGSGSIAPIVGLVGSSVTIPGSAGMLRSGYTLARWNTLPKGKGTSFVPGQQLNLTGSAELFAQWSGRTPASLYGAVGVFPGRSSKLTPSLKAEVNRLASSIKARKYSVITLYGYTANTGLASLNISLSRGRAVRVETYLRHRLNSMRLKNVRIKASGEGAVSGERGSTFSRVEVFVN